MPVSSESLFSSPSSGDDVRHDLKTVQKSWSKERIRRIKISMFIVIPLVIILIVAYLVVTHYYPELRLENISNPPFAMEMMEQQMSQKEESFEETSFGNPNAKLKFKVIPKYADKAIMNVLHTAVDVKPSEIYVEIVKEDEISQEELTLCQQAQNGGLKIDGQSKLPFTIHQKSGTLDLTTPFGMGFSADILSYVIKQYHEKHYGVPQYPIFPQMTEKFKEYDTPAPEEPKTQDFEFLPTPQEVPATPR